jgi:hypothetical protein
LVLVLTEWYSFACLLLALLQAARYLSASFAASSFDPVHWVTKDGRASSHHMRHALKIQPPGRLLLWPLDPIGPCAGDWRLRELALYIGWALPASASCCSYDTGQLDIINSVVRSLRLCFLALVGITTAPRSTRFCTRKAEHPHLRHCRFTYVNAAEQD